MVVIPALFGCVQGRDYLVSRPATVPVCFFKQGHSAEVCSGKV